MWIVCVPFSAIELGVVLSARCTGLSVSRTATLLGFSHLLVSRVYQEWSITQSTPSLLDTTIGRIGVNMVQHPCGTLLSTCRVHALTN